VVVLPVIIRPTAHLRALPGLVDTGGVEPDLYALSGVRSNHPGLPTCLWVSGPFYNWNLPGSNR